MVEAPEGETWELHCDGDWCQVTPQRGSGATPINITAMSENADGGERHATVLVLARDALAARLDVAQQTMLLGNAYLRAEPPRTDLIAGKTTQIDIKSNARWRVMNDTHWLNVSPQEGIGDGTLTVKVREDYNNPGKRTYRFLVQMNEGLKQTIYVVVRNLKGGKLKAFPTAEGFGKWAKGGREGKVLYVENLNGSGPGSLRAAVEAEGPRTVIFRTGGTVELERSLVIRNPYITIAGQTAPGGGVALKWKQGQGRERGTRTFAFHPEL